MKQMLTINYLFLVVKYIADNLVVHIYCVTYSTRLVSGLVIANAQIERASGGGLASYRCSCRKHV